MRPDSTSYPTLAAIDVAGITNPKVITETYIWSGMINDQIKEYNKYTYEQLSNQFDKLQNLIGMKAISLTIILCQNIRRAITSYEEEASQND